VPCLIERRARRVPCLIERRARRVPCLIERRAYYHLLKHILLLLEAHIERRREFEEPT